MKPLKQEDTTTMSAPNAALLHQSAASGSTEEYERAAAMVKPGGLLFVATLNRTAKSFALAIVGAEYILRWLPRGTHQWDKFVTPNELEIAIEQAGLRITGETGVIYDLFADRWRQSRDMDVNYMVVAERAA